MKSFGLFAWVFVCTCVKEARVVSVSTQFACF